MDTRHEDLSRRNARLLKRKPVATTHDDNASRAHILQSQRQPVPGPRLMPVLLTRKESTSRYKGNMKAAVHSHKPCSTDNRDIWSLSRFYLRKPLNKLLAIWQAWTADGTSNLHCQSQAPDRVPFQSVRDSKSTAFEPFQRKRSQHVKSAAIPCYLKPDTFKPTPGDLRNMPVRQNYRSFRAYNKAMRRWVGEWSAEIDLDLSSSAQ